MTVIISYGFNILQFNVLIIYVYKYNIYIFCKKEKNL